MKHISRDHGKKSSRKNKKWSRNKSKPSYSKNKESTVKIKEESTFKENEDLKCKKCLRFFIRKEVLQRHRTIDCIGTPITPPTQDYRCRICKKKFASSSSVGQHIKKIHGKKENYKTYIEYLKVDHELDAENESEKDVVINVKASKQGPVIEPKSREDLEHNLNGLKEKIGISNQSKRKKENNVFLQKVINKLFE